MVQYPYLLHVRLKGGGCGSAVKQPIASMGALLFCVPFCSRSYIKCSKFEHNPSCGILCDADFVSGMPIAVKGLCGWHIAMVLFNYKKASR